MQRIREPRRRLDAGAPSPPDDGAARAASSTRSRTDFNTPAALAALFGVGARGQPPREAASATRDLREMLACSARRSQPARGRRRAAADAEARELLPSAEQAARARRDFARADRLRGELRALGWEVRDGPGGRS